MMASPPVHKSSEIVIRTLEKRDLRNGYLETLDVFRPSSGITDEKLEEIFKRIDSNSGHMIFVADSGGMIVGCITLIIEPKFIHNGSYAAHIEDMTVRKEMRGHGIAGKLIAHAMEVARAAGCYKMVHDCTDELVEPYERRGFYRHENAMRYDYPSSHGE